MVIKGKGVLSQSIENFFENTPFGKVVARIFSDAMQTVYTGLTDWAANTLNRWRTNPYVSILFDGLTGIVRGGFKAKDIAALFLGLWAALAVVKNTFLGNIDVLSKYEANGVNPTERLDPQTWLQADWRKPGSVDKIKSDYRDLGFDEQRFEAIKTANTPVLDASTLMTLYNRGVMPLERFLAEVQRMGFPQYDAVNLEKLTHIIPGVNDLISMAVREAWNEEVVKRFEYDAERPDEAAGWAKKQGLDPEWFTRYWRAHWQLISPSQAFEMLHRLRPGHTKNPFTADDLNLLLKTADYPVFFRERLAEISYNPYTRVDVRRMYKLGVLNETDVYNSYRDIGYDDAHAKKMTEFTIKYETATDKTKIEVARDLTQGTIVSAYQKKIIDRGKAYSLLRDLRYEDEDALLILNAADFEKVVSSKPNYEQQFLSDLKSMIQKAYASRMVSWEQANVMLTPLNFTPEEVSLLLNNADFNYQESVLADTLKLIGEGYINHAYTYNEAITLLGRANITGSQQSQLFGEWEQQRTLRTKRLTESQYRAAAIAGIITNAEYHDELQGLGYTDYDIGLLMKLYLELPVTPLERPPLPERPPSPEFPIPGG